ncbi:hypothetical protein AOT83_01160 [Mycobacteroides sp. H001]|uniref:hypothetical protein n=1 Tax=Mycobacteroides TaxID=670516 RepID=UPI000713395C|nr:MULTISPECIES: hypothetical protein [Mycobacteroides]KRQ24204.1 hypothetical protein AOT86_15680 [Mycobacteroides sp. H072]KRQ32220.1 hypothetical protein AOT84_21725 [Mycobacteroides sp. H002]KRQ47787.1 hypothetical protein AOT85_20230 [Mycobacteroides sp. H054]KRQ73303.1 hypothetical protein AOT83_01160 [Mycobacteroides sp. H001]OHU33143.1 hypothetical protein BKG79_21160 [Mycobacteroides chelonae]
MKQVEVDRLADAIVQLDPRPRERRWASLSLCIIDAVWSIGARYDTVVVPLVREVAKEFGVEQPTVPASEPVGADPLPLTRLAGLSVDELTRLTNRQWTSTRGGILKSDAVLRHLHAFLNHGVDALTGAINVFGDETRFTALNAELRAIPGEGANAVRRDYLWMLVGQDDLIKPDRMMLRWFSCRGAQVDPAGVRELITLLIPVVGEKLNRRVTAWEIDHALWLAGRGV